MPQFYPVASELLTTSCHSRAHHCLGRAHVGPPPVHDTPACHDPRPPSHRRWGALPRRIHRPRHPRANWHCRHYGRCRWFQGPHHAVVDLRAQQKDSARVMHARPLLLLYIPVSWTPHTLASTPSHFHPHNCCKLQTHADYNTLPRYMWYILYLQNPIRSFMLCLLCYHQFAVPSFFRHSVASYFITSRSSSPPIPHYT